MSTPTLKSMLERYATEAIALDGPSAERPFDYSMNLPVEQCFPGCIAFIGFLKQLTGEIDPDLDDLSQNIVIGFLRLLKSEVPSEQYMTMCWDLREWLGWLHENSYTWIDLGLALETHFTECRRSAA